MSDFIHIVVFYNDICYICYGTKRDKEYLWVKWLSAFPEHTKQTIMVSDWAV